MTKTLSPAVVHHADPLLEDVTASHVRLNKLTDIEVDTVVVLYPCEVSVNEHHFWPNNPSNY